MLALPHWHNKLSKDLEPRHFIISGKASMANLRTLPNWQLRTVFWLFNLQHVPGRLLLQFTRKHSLHNLPTGFLQHHGCQFLLHNLPRWNLHPSDRLHICHQLHRHATAHSSAHAFAHKRSNASPNASTNLAANACPYTRTNTRTNPSSYA